MNALPAMALIGLAIKLDSPGPVVFRQRRVGHAGRSITIYKFRTMRQVEIEDERRAAMTPNKWSYVALFSRLIPNRMHSKALSKVQPGRHAKDVFPTAYLLNRPSAVERYFAGSADVYHYSTSAVPSYHFGRIGLMQLLRLVHRMTPPIFDVGLRFFIQKRVGSGSSAEGAGNPTRSRR